MSWARFDDGYSDNPKILEAGPWCELLDMRAIIYCARMSTDGLITRATLKRIGHGIPALSKRVQTLIDVGRWTTNEGGGWFVHDFLLYNPSKMQKDAERERGRERVRKHRTQQGGNGVTPANGLGDGTGIITRDENESARGSAPTWIRLGMTRKEWMAAGKPELDEDAG